MRTTWNGSISFSLVTIPVGLAPATKPSARASDVSFRQLHAECKTPIKNRRWCPVHEREVESDEIVRGWEVAKGQFVIVEDADLEAIERQNTSRSIDIERFVPLDEVDPVYFDRTYFLVPAAAPAALRPYVLLRNVLAGGAGRRDRPLRPRGQGEALPDPAEGRRARARDAVRRRGRLLAGGDRRGDRRRRRRRRRPSSTSPASSSTASSASSTRREQLTSEYRQDLRKMLEAKLAGQPIEEPEPVEEAPVIDLMDALKKSVAEAKQRKAPETKRAAKPRAKRAAAAKK